VAAEPPEPETLEAKRKRLARIEAWIREHDLAHNEMPRGLAAYAALAEDIQKLERRLVETWVGPPVIFPADTDTPMIAGKWERLPDGRIEATGLTLFDLRVMAYFRQLAREAQTEHERQNGD